MLVGGAKGGGKSQWLLFDPFYQINSEEARVARGEIETSIGRAIIFRRNYDHLRELIARARRLFPRVYPDVKWNGQTRTFTFPCGYEYVFGNMDEDDDWQKYYGIEYTWEGWDEICQFLERQVDELDTCLRTPDPVLQKMLAMRAGTNPIGVGLKWVRKRFVEVAPPNTPVIKRIEVDVIKDGKKVREVVEHQQMFIPSRVEDNPSINQAEYRATLSTKSDAMVRALRDGDWYVSDGAFVSALWDNQVHVCKPFKIPKGHHRFMSVYYAYEQPASASQWAVDPDGNLTCYWNLTVNHHDAEMFAFRIREVLQQLELWDARRDISKLNTWLGPEEAWGHEKHSGPNIAETFRRVGIPCWRADKDRRGADDQIRWRLARRTAEPGKPGKDKKPLLTVPGIRWFKTCKDPIETLPVLVANPDDPEVPLLKGTECWNYLDVGYACLSRPVVPKREMEDVDLAEQEMLSREFPKPRATARRTSYLW